MSCKTVKKTTPCPLFDTLERLSDPLPQSVDCYLNNLPIEQAQGDFKWANTFLNSYGGSVDTFNAYRRDIERFLHWCWLIQKKSITQIDRHAIRQYLTFIDDPPKAWISTKTVSRFIQDPDDQRIMNPAWRPFVVRIAKAQHKQGITPSPDHYMLSDKSRQALLATLSTFFTFLQQEDYVTHNPIQLIRQKYRYIQRQQQKKITRRLSDLQWQYVIETTEQLAAHDPSHERTLFMMSAFYLLGVRISELAETPGRIPKMGDFAPDKQGLWWFTTLGKGNKIRDIAVPDALINALKRYRLSQALLPLPTRDETTPLLHNTRGRSGLGTRQIRNLVQLCFNQAIERLNADNKKDAALDLNLATVHWLRHTAISAEINHRPRDHVRVDAGHENPATTEQYIESDRIERHRSAQNKSLYPHPKKLIDDPH